MPEGIVEIPASPADLQRAAIAQQNGATYDATAQTVVEPAADATPATPASSEPAQNDAPANSEAQGDATPTAVEAGGDAEDSTAQAAEPADGEPAQQQPGKNHVARKIDKLTRENAELQRQMQMLMSQRGNPQQPQQPQAPQAPADPKPDPAKYTDVAQFIADTSAWTSRQEAQRVVGGVLAQIAQQQAQAQVVQQASQEVQQFNERVTKGSADIKDFAQVTAASADVDVAPHVAATIMRGVDNPAVVLYHLAKNPGEVAKLNGLPPAKVAARLGAIEALAQRPPAISNAPAPGKPVAAKGGVPSGYSDDMTPEQFNAWRNGSKK